ncbi:MAG: hypothetical protein U5R30_03670 [Deltaproteobacteria bacterium]|nr:hypothetical protein [Deltaproteobacteria bacterium]
MPDLKTRKSSFRKKRPSSGSTPTAAGTTKAAGSETKRSSTSFMRRSVRTPVGIFYVKTGAIALKRFIFPMRTRRCLFLRLTLSRMAQSVKNTGKRLSLEPRKLYVQNDSLYVADGEQRVKFTERSLMAISGLMTFENENYFITQAGRKYPIEGR